MEAVVRGVVQFEGSPVDRETKHDLAGWEAAGDPVLDGGVHVEEIDVVSLAMVHGSVVAGLLVPRSVEVVGHQVKLVKRFSETRDVVSGINDGLTGRHGSTESKSMGLEGSL